MIEIKKLRADAFYPTRGSEHAAGLDIYTPLDFILSPGTTVSVPTGLAVAIPNHYVGMINPRSGLAERYQIDTLAGVIDSDYRGEIKVLLINHGSSVAEFKKGDRIAQLVVHAHTSQYKIVDYLEETGRGENGFGSTGK